MFQEKSRVRDGMFLDQIAQAKREEIAAARLRRPLGELQAAIEDAPQPRPWGSVLRVPGRVQLIAELKKASPSRGVLRADFDPLAIAQTYAQGGAAALSVLTDSTFFQGGLDLLPELRKVVDLPLLRKDFILDPYQIYESRVWGADAILLIVALLPGAQLGEFLELAGSLGLAALVEVHTEEELEAALSTPAPIIGINNRDLRTLEVSLETTARLRPRVPAERIVVSESGISTAADVAWLKAQQVDAMLVGEALICASDRAAKVRELLDAGPPAEKQTL
jgi:indole-3-glycerol phosphate synthase